MSKTSRSKKGLTFTVEKTKSGLFDVFYHGRPIAYDRHGYEVGSLIEAECAYQSIPVPREVEVNLPDGDRYMMQTEYL